MLNVSVVWNGIFPAGVHVQQISRNTPTRKIRGGAVTTNGLNGAFPKFLSERHVWNTFSSMNLDLTIHLTRWELSVEVEAARWRHFSQPDLYFYMVEGTLLRSRY